MFSSTAIEIIKWVNFFAVAISLWRLQGRLDCRCRPLPGPESHSEIKTDKSKGVPASCGLGPHRTWNTAWKSIPKFVTPELFLRINALKKGPMAWHRAKLSELTHSTIFEEVEQNLLGLSFNLEAGHYFYREFAFRKINYSGAFVFWLILDNIQFQVKKKEGSYSNIFEGFEQNLLGLILNLEAGHHFNRVCIPKYIKLWSIW
jgi:hypothetical protein